MTSPVHAHLATDPSSAGLGLFVTCPECGAYFELTDALVAPIRARLAEESQAALQAARVAIRKEESERARAKLNIEQQDLRNQVQEKDALLTKSNEAELKLRRKVREMEEAANDAELAQARRDDEVRRQVEAEAKERYGVKLKAKDEQLRRVEREAEDLRRKASTGSAQEEGLARQELFGEWLKSRYPSDEVVVTRRGQSGADVQWTVRSLSGTRLGDILFETKWTANWGNDWVGKLKADQQRLGVGIAGIVSASLPKGADPVCQMDGVWVCDFHHALLLSMALREIVLQAAAYEVANANREEVSAKVYDYVATGGFGRRVASMVLTMSNQRADWAKLETTVLRLCKAGETRLKCLERELALMVGDLLGLGAALPEEATIEGDLLSPATTLSLVPPGPQLGAS